MATVPRYLEGLRDKFCYNYAYVRLILVKHIANPYVGVVFVTWHESKMYVI